MKKTFVGTLVLLGVIFLIPIACRQEQVASDTSAAAETATTTDTAATVTDSAQIALTGTTAPASGSVVRVDFHNLICHFLQTSPPKAAFFNDANHTAILRIMQPTAIDVDGPKSEVALTAAFGNNVNVSCDTDKCTVFPLDGLALRVIDSDDKSIEPALTFGGDFDLLVPHLQTVAKVAAMNPKANDKVPSADFRTFFNLDGGLLSAKPYCAMLTLQHTDTSKVTIPTAQIVTLTGASAKPARLELTRDGTNWTKLEFKGSSKLIWLVLDNKPNPGHEDRSHFEMHTKAGDGTSTADYPKVFAAPRCVAASVAACGNTQWP